MPWLQRDRAAALQSPCCSVLLQGPKASWFSELDTDVKMNESVFEWWLWLECVSGFHWLLHLMMPDKGPHGHLFLAPVVASSSGVERTRSFWQPIFRFMASFSLIAKIPLFTSPGTTWSLKGDYSVIGIPRIPYRLVQGTLRATQPRHPAPLQLIKPSALLRVTHHFVNNPHRIRCTALHWQPILKGFSSPALILKRSQMRTSLVQSYQSFFSFSLPC